ncbi:hypothetical protein [Salinisphaera orenii]|uniref:Uncharacterized protein n=1 Tax=Salinisphaera orenii YIM 95161 TaxID=1051139 RepID=A0A423PEJ9_9GAMM|nr:hypothetical protein [Salinisphaera halophila]ROO23943.1 hypothetical protein SAHL_16045 [Salinisphaera halophila YIM 95161]
MRDINYVRMAFAVAGGLVIGWIAMRLIAMLLGAVVIGGLMSSISDAIEFDSTPESSVTSSRQYRDAQATERQAQARQRQRQAENRRAQTPKGKQLRHTCAEWRRNQRMTPTETTRINAEFHCDRYGRYLQTGSLRPR